MNRFIYKTQYADILIEDNGQSIVRIEILNDSIEDMKSNETDLIKVCKTQLMEYFKGERVDFNFPIEPFGTEFQKKVWNSLVKVPYGQTRSYKEIAESIDHPKAYRAVGLANNKNPIQIVIPCHRIIGSNKKLIGYRGGIDIKEKLLLLEKNTSLNLG